MRTVSIDREDDWFLIAYRETEVTPQGPSRLESPLLADALTAFENCAADPLGIAEGFAPGSAFEEDADDGR